MLLNQIISLGDASVLEQIIDRAKPKISFLGDRTVSVDSLEGDAQIGQLFVKKMELEGAEMLALQSQSGLFSFFARIFEWLSAKLGGRTVMAVPTVAERLNPKLVALMERVKTAFQEKNWISQHLYEAKERQAQEQLAQAELLCRMTEGPQQQQALAHYFQTLSSI